MTYSSSNETRPVVVEREDSPLGALGDLWEKIRQVHALEHATLWVLSEQNPKLRLGGLSTDRGFFIYGPIDSGALLRAAHLALGRINQGEDKLAIHPQCGTNLSVGMLLTAGFGLGVSLALPRRPLQQAVGIGAAAIAAVQISNTLGALVQQHITTAVPRNLEIVGVRTLTDWVGRQSHFVQTHYVG